MRRERPFFSPEEMTPVMLINEISKLFFDSMRTESEKIGLRRGYHHVLFHLSRTDGVTQLDLARLTHLKAPTISITLQNMEADGLVRRLTDTIDQRETRVYITEKGRMLEERLKELIRRNESLLMRGLSEEEELLLKKILLKIRSNVVDDSFARSPCNAESGE